MHFDLEKLEIGMCPLKILGYFILRYIEATANCTLEDVNYFERQLMITKEEMQPRPPASVKLEHQILMAQVISPSVLSIL